jgi:26S proteasome regulatory subunit N5
VQGIPSLPELKLVYYNQLIQYHSHSDNFLEIARCFLALYDSEGVKEDAAKWPAVRPPPPPPPPRAFPPA